MRGVARHGDNSALERRLTRQEIGKAGERPGHVFINRVPTVVEQPVAGESHSKRVGSVRPQDIVSDGVAVLSESEMPGTGRRSERRQTGSHIVDEAVLQARSIEKLQRRGAIRLRRSQFRRISRGPRIADFRQIHQRRRNNVAFLDGRVLGQGIVRSGPVRQRAAADRDSGSRERRKLGSFIGEIAREDGIPRGERVIEAGQNVIFVDGLIAEGGGLPDRGTVGDCKTVGFG